MRYINLYTSFAVSVGAASPILRHGYVRYAVSPGPDVGVVAQTVTRTLLNVSEIKDGAGNV